MATNKTFNNENFSFPNEGEDYDGDHLTDFFASVCDNAFQKSGGNFTLTADANFGANFGLLSQYFTSRSVNGSTAGVVRLSAVDKVGWRNNANGGNLLLGTGGDDKIEFNGVDLVDASTAQTLTNKTLTNPTINGQTGLPLEGLDNVGGSPSADDFLVFDGSAWRPNSGGPGTIVAIAAGSGLSGGGGTGTINLAVVAGDGISVAASPAAVSVNSTVVRTSGAQSIAGVKTYSDNAIWTDNDEVRLGTGSDLRFYHDGTHSYIDNDTGNLVVTAPGTISINGVDAATYVVNTRALTAGSGLTGGGNLTADRTFNVGQGTGITVSADAIATNDSEIVHDNLSGFVANEHIDHTSVTITAGSGLTGGGDISTSRTINVGAGDGISVAADSVAVDSTVLRTSGGQSASGLKVFTNGELRIANDSGFLGFYDTANSGRSGYLQLHGSSTSTLMVEENQALVLGTNSTTRLTLAANGATANFAVTTLQVNGNTVWHSANDGAGSGLDADLLDGFNSASTATANTIALRNSSGYLFAGYFNQSSSGSEIAAPAQFFVETGNDGYMRKSSLAQTATAISSQLGLSSMATQSSASVSISGGSISGLSSLAVSGAITATGDITAFSDERLKENVVPIDNALLKVLNLTGYTFNKKTETRRSTGVIAQEVEKVLPEAVYTHEDGIKSVAYGNLVGLLIQSIKELEARVRELEAA